MNTVWAIDLSHSSGDETKADVEHVEASDFVDAAFQALRLAKSSGMLVSAVVDTGELAD